MPKRYIKKRAPKRRTRRVQRGRGYIDVLNKIPTVIGGLHTAVGIGNGLMDLGYGTDQTVGTNKSILEYLLAKKRGLI